jgi:hypothetical protein
MKVYLIQYIALIYERFKQYIVRILVMIEYMLPVATKT